MESADRRLNHSGRAGYYQLCQTLFDSSWKLARKIYLAIYFLFRQFKHKIVLFFKKIIFRFNSTVFYCNALYGQSTYNICINCDMTVSCNCADYDGSGHIGDLHVHTFEEIFRGRKAQIFRETLARGEYPIHFCSSCFELRTIHKREADKFTHKFNLPRKGIMVENTIRCNLSCRFCKREDTYKIRRKKAMSLDDIEQVATILHKYHIEQICYHNLGEPFVSDTIHKEILKLRHHNPGLRIFASTNGNLIDAEEKIAAALMLDLLIFSIDGPNQELLVKYQIGGSFVKAYSNMKRVVAEREKLGRKKPIIEWKYVVFNWNDQEEHIKAAMSLAKEAGVDLISFVKGNGTSRACSKRFTNSEFFKNLGQQHGEAGRYEIWFSGKQP